MPVPVPVPATERRRWTREEVLALIAAEPLQTPRYEVVGGELFVTSSPNPSHQRAVRELILALHAFVSGAGLGEVLHSPFDVEVEPGTLTQPDVFVVPPVESRRLTREPPARVLLLAVEVISPSSARGDRGKKRELFQRTVPEYWIVDLDARLVERWRPGEERPEVLREVLRWSPSGAVAPFELHVAGFFARVLGEEG